MPRHLSLISLVIGVALAGAGAFLALRSTLREADAPEPPRVAAPSSPAPATPANEARPNSRSGRVFSLDEAIRELDLIRPSRQKAADDFTLKLADGRSFRLADHKGKVILINFWATWCPPCLEEMPAMERLWQQHRGDGFVLLAVSVDSQPGVVPPFLRDHRLSFAAGLDPSMTVANSYGVRALPSSFLVDRHGNLAALALGPRAWDNDAAHSLLEGLLR
jgi:peroxiredoxin